MLGVCPRELTVSRSATSAFLELRQSVRDCVPGRLGADELVELRLDPQIAFQVAGMEWTRWRGWFDVGYASPSTDGEAKPVRGMRVAR
jgi:hypothetical protein